MYLIVLLTFSQVLERLNDIQKEVMTTIQELNKSHKSYREEHREACEAKMKATNVDTKYAVFYYVTNHYINRASNSFLLHTVIVVF